MARPRRPPRDCFPGAGIACQAPLTHYPSGPASPLCNAWRSIGPLRAAAPSTLIQPLVFPLSPTTTRFARPRYSPPRRPRSPLLDHCCARSGCSRDRAPPICFSPLVVLRYAVANCSCIYCVLVISFSFLLYLVLICTAN